MMMPSTTFEQFYEDFKRAVILHGDGPDQTGILKLTEPRIAAAAKRLWDELRGADDER